MSTAPEISERRAEGCFKQTKKVFRVLSTMHWIAGRLGVLPFIWNTERDRFISPSPFCWKCTLLLITMLQIGIISAVSLPYLVAFKTTRQVPSIGLIQSWQICAALCYAFFASHTFIIAPKMKEQIQLINGMLQFCQNYYGNSTSYDVK